MVEGARHRMVWLETKMPLVRRSAKRQPRAEVLTKLFPRRNTG